MARDVRGRVGRRKSGLDWSGNLRRVPVGGKLFVSLRVAAVREARFFGALDLGHPTVVDDELDDAIAEALDFFAHKGDPVG
jgi:hypothetical protein